MLLMKILKVKHVLGAAKRNFHAGTDKDVFSRKGQADSHVCKNNNGQLGGHTGLWYTSCIKILLSETVRRVMVPSPPIARPLSRLC